MDHCDESLPPLPLPPRMFAMGEEPVRVRVTPYHKPTCICKILNALDPCEVQRIRETPFGKLVEIADKPSFSGRFGRFLLSRQLKVLRKHEAWFIFAGKPIRFSLREFALVTGLNCRNYPPRTKKKTSMTIAEKSYWGELFGSMKEVPVNYVITMLKRKIVSDSEMRIKYALLALLSAVLLPTSHNPRILGEYVEKLKDIDQFLDYPWGRASFEMLISSLKERDEVSLSQKTIALKGFVLSIQLVLIEAAPSITRVVQAGSSSDSEGDFQDEDDFVDDDTERKKSINPVHVRDIDSSWKTHVVSIITDGVHLDNIDEEIHWPNAEEDILVTNLEKCIDSGFSFRNSHFIGGATAADVIRMRVEASKGNKARKTSKRAVNSTGADAVDFDDVVSILKSSLSADLCRIEGEIKNLSHSLTKSQSQMRSYIEDMFVTFQRNVTNLIPTPCTRTHVDPPYVPQADTTAQTDETTAVTSPSDPCHIIQSAMRFANLVEPRSGDVPPSDAGAVRLDNTNVEHEPVVEDDFFISPQLPQRGNFDITDNANISTAQTGARLANVVQRTPSASVPSPPPIVVAIEENSNLDNVNIRVAQTLACLADVVQRTPSTSVHNNPPPVVVDIEENSNLTNLAFPKPTFSLGLTQEGRNIFTSDASVVGRKDDQVPPVDLVADGRGNVNGEDEPEVADDSLGNPQPSQRGPVLDYVNYSDGQKGSCPGDGVQRTPSTCLVNISPPGLIDPEANSNLVSIFFYFLK